MICAHAEAGLVAAQAFIDAGLHRSIEMVHDRPPIRRAIIACRSWNKTQVAFGCSRLKQSVTNRPCRLGREVSAIACNAPAQDL
jgi:hypothetical protein